MYSKSVRRLSTHCSSIQKYINVRHASDAPNQNYIIGSSFPNFEIPNLTLHEFIFSNWSNFPNRIALECGITGKKYTFEEVRRKSINLSASFLKKLKLQKGYVVAIMLPNTPEYAVCVLGALSAGLIITTVNPLYTIDEVSRHLTESVTKVVITLPSLIPMLQKYSTKITIIGVKQNEAETLPDGAISFNELIDEFQEAPLLSIDFNDVAVMPSSSGSSGFPKIVELTHKNIVANVCQINHPTFDHVTTSTTDHQATLIGILPFFHVAGLIATLLPSLKNMSKIVTLPRFQPDMYIKSLEVHKPHFLQVIPFIVNFLSNEARVTRNHFDRVHLIGSAAAPLSAADEERILQKGGQHIHMFQAYGMTEATGLVSAKVRKDSSSSEGRGSVGEPFQNTLLKIVDDMGQALGPNLPGEILVKGPQVMKGYYKKTKETQDTFSEGWFKTGDIGYYTENKIFYVTDRLKDLIKVKGFQVAPAELEAVIRLHPCVLEVGVVGVPHDVYGEVPKAFVTLKKDSNIKPQEIEHFVSEKVVAYKHLKGGVVFMESLPKLASGKITRAKLRELAKNSER